MVNSERKKYIVYSSTALQSGFDGNSKYRSTSMAYRKFRWIALRRLIKITHKIYCWAETTLKSMILLLSSCSGYVFPFIYKLKNIKNGVFPVSAQQPSDNKLEKIAGLCEIVLHVILSFIVNLNFQNYL